MVFFSLNSMYTLNRLPNVSFSQAPHRMAPMGFKHSISDPAAMPRRMPFVTAAPPSHPTGQPAFPIIQRSRWPGNCRALSHFQGYFRVKCLQLHYPAFRGFTRSRASLSCSLTSTSTCKSLRASVIGSRPKTKGDGETAREGSGSYYWMGNHGSTRSSSIDMLVGKLKLLWAFRCYAPWPCSQ